MKFLSTCAGLMAWAGLAWSQSIAPTLDDLNIDPSEIQSDICGQIVSSNLYENSAWFFAYDAMSCLLSVPFNAAVATRFLTWYTRLLQFQSSTAFVRNPPPGYQQPAYDVFANLQRIQSNVDTGYYRNQYTFEADVQTVVLGMHDDHVNLLAGVLNQFTFSAPFYLISVSTDGKQAPEIYDYNDLYEARTSGGYTASPIVSINDMPVIDFLEQFASQQSFGMVDPDSDWNQLMASAAQILIGGANTFSAGAEFYPGDNGTVTHKNGTSTDFFWLALYNSPGFTGPLTTGGDFYNYFVLGQEPANYNETYSAYLSSTNNADTDADANTTPPMTFSSWHQNVSAYPADTISHQANLAIDASGFITGYFLADISTAVISIPSFAESGDGIGTFSQAVIDFVSNATEPSRKASRVIIDLQQNSGGEGALAFDAFRTFFPNRTPFSGSRMRSHPQADVLGSILTGAFQNTSPNNDDAYDDLVSEEWVVTDRINAATGQNFTSWQEFYGPLVANGDNFSLVEQYNLSSPVFVADALGVIFGEDDCADPNGCDTWNPDDIVILTDGTCSSTCALFVEMFTQIGARSVVVGGRPNSSSAMQLVGGSRGAASYNSMYLDYDYYDAQLYDASASDGYDRDTGMVVIDAGFNLRDQIRVNATTPNQFLFLPATCRIWWTMANFNDYNRLWHDTWNAIYNDTSLCVATSPSNSTSVRSPSLRKRSSGDKSPGSISHYIAHALSLPPPSDTSAHAGIQDSAPAFPAPLTFCDGPANCPSGTTCYKTAFPCMNDCSRSPCPTVDIYRGVCVRQCTVKGSGGSTCGATCSATRPLNSIINGLSRSAHSRDVHPKRVIAPELPFPKFTFPKHSSPEGRTQVPRSAPKLQNGVCLPRTGTGTTLCSMMTDRMLQRIASGR